MHMVYKLQSESIAELAKIPPGTVAEASARLGLNGAEPLLVAMDALMRYAKAYRTHFEAHLRDDDVLGSPWLQAVQGIHALLDGDGAVAMERDITTDSKDNGVIEGMYWHALRLGGFDDIE